ncbi:hypothetical protein CN884_04020 [Ochrobactrum sp. 30A/1000/2015]|nr:hypothetical protein A7J42_00200 [Brucella intermedia]PJT27561.1 hypothetical protein CN884_04020 [Ochrobactrum sp. 30A/1000/2015]PJT39104.1 hypothetical protein CN883_10190 [Ochrobactrum sp. 27A/999/2015]PJT44998.1 hypothetical protein CN882_04020 [Ochrobactrum sp. 23A/997/2015]
MIVPPNNKALPAFVFMKHIILLYGKRLSIIPNKMLVRQTGNIKIYEYETKACIIARGAVFLNDACGGVCLLDKAGCSKIVILITRTVD